MRRGLFDIVPEFKATPPEVLAARKRLNEFIPKSEMHSITSAMRGEEREFFWERLLEIDKLIAEMPKTYDTREQGDEAVAYLHYFKGGCDFFITEKDVGDEEEPGQHQAYGLADIGYGGEVGYISIVELLENEVELDLHFTPKTLKEIKAKRESA